MFTHVLFYFLEDFPYFFNYFKVTEHTVHLPLFWLLGVLIPFVSISIDIFFASVPLVSCVSITSLFHRSSESFPHLYWIFALNTIEDLGQLTLLLLRVICSQPLVRIRKKLKPILAGPVSLARTTDFL